jgi:hypothetical protein
MGLVVDGGADTKPELDVDFASVLRAVRAAALGKRRSPDVAAFLLDIESHAFQLVRELRTGTWRPSTPRAFYIREPKLRLISALPFRDRVVQHLLIAATAADDPVRVPRSATGLNEHRHQRAYRAASDLRQPPSIRPTSSLSFAK